MTDTEKSHGSEVQNAPAAVLITSAPTPNSSTDPEHADQKKKMSVLRGVSTIISLMIGSGIFSTPGEIHRFVGSMGLSFMVWTATGLLSLLGALCYAELGTAVPGSGGEAQYLLRGFGPTAAALFDWISILVLKPGSVTITANHFARHAVILFYLLTTPKLQDPVMINGILQSPEQLFIEQKRLIVAGIAFVMILLVTGLSVVSSSACNRIIDTLTLSKVVALILIVSAGVVNAFIRPVQAANNFVVKDSYHGGTLPISAWPSLELLALAMNQGLWSFEGWNNLNIVAGDLQNPSRNLPIAIWTSVMSVIGMYLTALLGYYLVVDADIVKQSTIVAVEFGKLAFRLSDSEHSRWGACMMAAFVCASTFAAALSSMVTSSEIIVLSSNRGFLPSLFATTKKGNALYAYIMQGVLAAALLLPLVVSPQGADALMTFYSFPTWLFYASCVVVLLKLRFSDPDLLRPYKVWPTTPALFLLACGLLIVFTTRGSFVPVMVSIAVTGLGVPVFWYRARKHPRLLKN
jgi:amino acid transporter